MTLQSRGEGGIRLPDQLPNQEGEGRNLNFGGGDHGRSVSCVLLAYANSYGYRVQAQGATELDTGLFNLMSPFHIRYSAFDQQSPNMMNWLAVGTKCYFVFHQEFFNSIHFV